LASLTEQDLIGGAK